MNLLNFIEKYEEIMEPAKTDILLTKLYAPKARAPSPNLETTNAEQFVLIAQS